MKYTTNNDFNMHLPIELSQSKLFNKIKIVVGSTAVSTKFSLFCQKQLMVIEYR